MFNNGLPAKKIRREDLIEDDDEPILIPETSSSWFRDGSHPFFSQNEPTKDAEMGEFKGVTNKNDLDSVTDSSKKPSFILLRPEYRPAFIQIVNYLDVSSFLELCLASKELHRFCMNTKGIEVHLWKGEATASNNKFTLSYTNCLHESNRPYDHRSTEVFRKNPFRFHLSELRLFDLEPCEAQDLAELRSFLKGVGMKSIGCTKAVGPVNMTKCCKEFICILQEMKVERIVTRERIPDEVISYIVQNVHSFDNEKEIDDRFIIEATIPKLILPFSNISQETLTGIIQNWASGLSKIDFWQISASFNLYPFQEYFTTFDFNYNGPLSEERPLIFHRKSVIYVLREDCKLLSVSFQLPKLTLRSCERFSYPEVVKTLLSDSY